MKRVSLFCCVGVLVLGLFCMPALAFDTPAGAPAVGTFYISGPTTQLGDVVVYIPTNYDRDAFSYTENFQPVNVTSSTITGYIYSSSGDISYTVRWSAPFGTAEYREYESSGWNDWRSLTFTNITETNFSLVKSFDSLTVDQSQIVLFVIVVFLGVIMLCLFIKRF